MLCLFWPLRDSLIEFIVHVSFNLPSHLAEVITLLVKWFSGCLPGSSSPWCVCVCVCVCVCLCVCCVYAQWECLYQGMGESCDVFKAVNVNQWTGEAVGFWAPSCQLQDTARSLPVLECPGLPVSVAFLLHSGVALWRVHSLSLSWSLQQAAGTTARQKRQEPECRVLLKVAELVCLLLSPGPFKTIK